MNVYYIDEYDTDMSLLELRIGELKDCNIRKAKISKILDFLNTNNFLTRLTMILDDDTDMSLIPEFLNIPSLSINMRDGRLCFKYWNGHETIWVYHTEDLFRILIDKRNEYIHQYKQYMPITDILMEMKDALKTCIRRVTYHYAPHRDIPLRYHIIFTQSAMHHNMYQDILDGINLRINNLDMDLNSLAYDIDYSFEDDECLSCQKE